MGRIRVVSTLDILTLLLSLLFVAIVIPTIYPTVQAAAATIDPIADTYVDEKYHWMNKGDHNILAVWAFGDKYISFIKFDLNTIPSSANIVSAELFLHVVDYSVDSNDPSIIGAHSYSNNSWGEHDLSWDTVDWSALNETATDTTQIYVDKLEHQVWFNWTIVEDVESAKGNFLTVVLMAENEVESIFFHSRETLLKPYLNITYSFSTLVGGIISENTTWTLEDSPYFFVDDVTVDEGVTLIIEPGVTVDLDLWSLVIEGTLYARGTESNRIRFQSSEKPLRSWPPRIYFTDSSTRWNETTGTGCIVEYAEINVVNYQYETIRGGFPKMSNSIIFNYANDAAAIYVNGGMISNNTIMGGYRGIATERSEGGLILYNVIKETGSGGAISIGFETAPTIIGNLLIDNSEGITFWGSEGPYVANNTIVRNTVGFRFTSYISASSLGAIVYNNVHSNGYDIVVEKEDPRIIINMTYNWWGTTNTALIDQKIYDQKDDRRLSLVNYAPLLTSPATSIDNTAPTTLHDYDDLWHTTDFTITLTATDDLSGVAETYYKINDEPTKSVSVDGQPYITTESANNTLEYWSVDNAGNEELPHKILTGIKLDKTQPTSAIDLSGVVGNNDWFISNVTITLAAIDNVSGADNIKYSFDNITWTTYIIPFIITDERNSSIYYKSTDKAGNAETIKTETIKIDKTPPYGPILINENATYVNSTSVTLTLSSDDTASGVAQMRFSNNNITWTPWETYSTSKAWALTTGDGTKTVYVQYVDNAGLVSQSYSDAITLDTTSPTIIITSPSLGYEVQSSTITVTWTGSDGTSGISHYKIKLDDHSWINVGTNTTHTFTELNDGSHTIDVKAIDNAALTKQDSVNFIVNTSPLLGPGYIEEAAVLAAAIIVAIGIALYFLKIRKR